jgi:molybdenum cofactor biosynthesis protein B
MMAYEAHIQSSHAIAARCAVLTLSDTRTEQTDASGARIRQLLAGAGHEVGLYRIVCDEPTEFEPVLLAALADDSIDMVLTNGGTGVSRRDQTIEAVERHISWPLPGFGELFRMLSWEQIGSGAMLSRALAGIAHGKPLFCMPGSTKAVELAMTRLILPEIKHLLGELRK